MPRKKPGTRLSAKSEVRQATKSDVHELVRLNALVQLLHARLYPNLFTSKPDSAELTRFFAELAAADKHWIGVVEGTEGLLGYVWIEVHERGSTTFTKSVRRLHIHHIAVASDQRRKGVGSALLNWVFDQARAAGISEVTVEHWAANTEAHAFFSRKGFHDLRIVMTRTVTDSA